MRERVSDTAALIDRIGDRDVILSFSGGKDSTACGLWLQERGIPFRPLFLDTGWEHRDTYAHIEKLEALFGPVIRCRSEIQPTPAYAAEIAEIEALLGWPSPFVRWMVHKAMFPSRKRRYCTQELKTRPFMLWADAHDAEIVNVIGIRRDESEARASWPEWAGHPDAPSVEVFAPGILWTVADVIEIHQRHGVEPCPLYLRWSSRLGCWPCINANREELRGLAQDLERTHILRLVEALVKRIAHERGHNYAPDEDGNEGSPTFFQARIEEKGKAIRYPSWPIDKVLAWANRVPRRRAWQMDMFAAIPSEAGCARWGMCEHPAARRGVA